MDTQDKADLDQMVQETVNSIMDPEDPKWNQNLAEATGKDHINEILKQIEPENHAHVQAKSVQAAVQAPAKPSQPTVKAPSAVVQIAAAPAPVLHAPKFNLEKLIGDAMEDIEPVKNVKKAVVKPEAVLVKVTAQMNKALANVKATAP